EWRAQPVGARLGKVFRDAAQDPVLGLILTEFLGWRGILASGLEIHRFQGRAIEVADGSPFFAVYVNRESRRPKALREIPPVPDVIAHLEDIQAIDIAHLADLTHFHENDPLRVARHGHAGFEDDVEPRLP